MRLIEAHCTKVEQEASENGRYNAVVAPEFHGIAYFLYVYEVYRDIRLVGAPPASIGSFGFDTDNWEWPRHTGDFCLFRIYTAPDGSPAPYAPENIPLQTDYYLTISLQGVAPDTFTFTLGYPGSTSRYGTSFELQETAQITNAQRIKIRSLRLDMLGKAMAADQQTAVQYASKYARSSNYLKYAIGQNLDIRRRHLPEMRQETEARFQAWAQADSGRFQKYGHVLDSMESLYRQKHDAEVSFSTLSEAIFNACELINFISEFSYLDMLLRSKTDRRAAIAAKTEELKQETRQFFKNYQLDLDRQVSTAMLTYYLQNSATERYPDMLRTEMVLSPGHQPSKMIRKLYQNSFFTREKQVMHFLDHPTSRQLKRDFGFRLANSFYQSYISEYALLKAYQEKLTWFEYRYTQGRMQMQPEAFPYPDADLNLRLSYGSLQAYQSADSAHCQAQTYLSGVMQKEDTANSHFRVPQKLKTLYFEKDFSPYSQGDDLPVCFITTNDITGGNSGSPVFNSQGYLVGLAFDGNWEALAGDFEYESQLQRCICADIRYILFIIDKFAGANHLINELKILP